MSNAFFFDIDVLIRVNNKVWIVDKNEPNIPIMKISHSDFNLLKNGVYKNQGNKIEYNGSTYWIPDYLFNKLKIKLKLSHGNLANIGISMQEFLNRDVIDNIEFKILIENITHLKNINGDIYIICSKQTSSNYKTFITKLEDRLKEEGITIKKFYFISETFYNQNEDDIKFKKIRLLIQHLVGYRTNGNKFSDEEITRYNTINYYDNQYDTIKMVDDVNIILKSLLNKSDDGIKSVIKEDISEYRPVLIVNQITDNELNRKIIKRINLDYVSLIKTFERFNLLKSKI